VTQTFCTFVFAFLLFTAPVMLCAQAKLGLERGGALFCPTESRASLPFSFMNLDATAQTIPANLTMTFTFNVPVVGGGTASSAVETSVAGSTLRVRFPTAYTVAGKMTSAWFASAYLDLSGIADRTLISYAIAITPPGALVLQNGEGIAAMVDSRACTRAAALSVDDISSACPSAAEIAAFNAQIDVRFESDPSAGTLVCKASEGSADLTRLQERAYQALRLMQVIPFEKPLPWTSRSLYDWFVHAVRGIRLRSDISNAAFCCDPKDVINVQSGDIGQGQYLTGAQLATLMSVFAHEARHNEGFPHTCSAAYSRDQTLEEMGARAIDYYLFEWMAFHSGLFFTPGDNLPPGYYRSYFWQAAQDKFNSSICELGPGLVVAPRSVDFGTHSVGKLGVSRTIVATATMGSAAALGPVTISGLNSSDFVVASDGCTGATVPPSCVVSIGFQPQAMGSRSAELHIGSLRVQLSGTGGTGPCDFSLEPSNVTVGSAGSRGSLSVTTDGGCSWGATSNVAWLTISSGTSGTGTGSVGYLVAADNSSTLRVGTLRIAGQTFSVTQSRKAAPQITLAGIGNAANYVTGKVAPGEIIVVYGSSFGPAALTQLHYSNGVADAIVGNTRIYFDNVAAPMIYAITGSPSVLSCVVPYGVAGKTSTQVWVEYNGVKSNTLTVPVVDAVPGIFSLNQDGTGPGAILNWPDYTVNAAYNRVAAGGYVMAYATGEGKTDIAIDGQKVPLAGPCPKPLLGPWTATVGGKPATVTYYSSAPDNIAGLFQVNVQVPSDLTPGIYDLVIKAGSFTSQKGLTVAVK
jgi:uncharacterized protein (TIGR03437 family)